MTFTDKFTSSEIFDFIKIITFFYKFSPPIVAWNFKQVWRTVGFISSHIFCLFYAGGGGGGGLLQGPTLEFQFSLLTGVGRPAIKENTFCYSKKNSNGH